MNQIVYILWQIVDISAEEPSRTIYAIYDNEPAAISCMQAVIADRLVARPDSPLIEYEIEPVEVLSTY